MSQIPSGISRDRWHKRRKTGGRRAPLRKKRKFELGRPAANTKVLRSNIHYLLNNWVNPNPLRCLCYRCIPQFVKFCHLSHADFDWLIFIKYVNVYIPKLTLYQMRYSNIRFILSVSFIYIVFPYSECRMMLTISLSEGLPAVLAFKVALLKTRHSYTDCHKYYLILVQDNLYQNGIITWDFVCQFPSLISIISFTKSLCRSVPSAYILYDAWEATLSTEPFVLSKETLPGAQRVSICLNCFCSLLKIKTLIID